MFECWISQHIPEYEFEVTPSPGDRTHHCNTHNSTPTTVIELTTAKQHNYC